MKFFKSELFVVGVLMVALQVSSQFREVRLVASLLTGLTGMTPPVGGPTGANLPPGGNSAPGGNGGNSSSGTPPGSDPGSIPPTSYTPINILLLALKLINDALNQLIAILKQALANLSSNQGNSGSVNRGGNNVQQNVAPPMLSSRLLSTSDGESWNELLIKNDKCKKVFDLTYEDCKLTAACCQLQILMEIDSIKMLYPVFIQTMITVIQKIPEKLGLTGEMLDGFASNCTQNNNYFDTCADGGIIMQTL